jgi:hypothetical protein
MKDKLKNKETFMGVEEIHTLMLVDDEDKNLYLGMEVFNMKKDKHEQIVLIIRPEDHEYLLNYLLEKKIEKDLVN